jgi:ribosomal protein S20
VSAKRYKLEVSSSAERIRKARKFLQKLPKVKRIDLMVKAGVMTEEQADRAKKKLAEMEA